MSLGEPTDDDRSVASLPTDTEPPGMYRDILDLLAQAEQVLMIKKKHTANPQNCEKYRYYCFNPKLWTVCYIAKAN